MLILRKDRVPFRINKPPAPKGEKKNKPPAEGDRMNS